MVSINVIKALQIISKKMNDHKIKWALVGSTNMQMQGMPVTPRDLDIVVKLQDLYKMPSIFAEYNSSEVLDLPPMTSEPGWEVKANIFDADVQILGELDTGEYVSKLLNNRVTIIDIDEMQIPCFTLDAEAQTYQETNREHKAKLIRDFLRQNNKENKKEN